MVWDVRGVEGVRPGVDGSQRPAFGYQPLTHAILPWGAVRFSLMARRLASMTAKTRSRAGRGAGREGVVAGVADFDAQVASSSDGVEARGRFKAILSELRSNWKTSLSSRSRLGTW